MSRKKAKFVIEIAYDNDDAGYHDDRNIEILEYDAQGDYRGLTLALTTGLGFATKKGSTDVEKFKDKLRVLRAVTSAVTSIFGTFRRLGAIPSALASDKIEDVLGEALKKMTDLTTLGIANTLDVTEIDVLEANEEYKTIHEQNKNKKDGTEQERGTDEDDFNDYV